jgi:1-aminocyclopropane-1-carboxylate deaminase/D-cysteine desulfhydrase-like pyridoxal-dependent ACC family enzyme
MKKIFSFLLIFQLTLIVNVFGLDTVSIIPEPVKISRTSGNYFLPKNFVIETNSNSAEVKEMILQFTKKSLRLSIPKDAANLKVITYRGNKPVGKLIVMPVAEMKRRAALRK